MNEQLNNSNDKAMIKKIDDGIKSIHELRSALSVLRMVGELNNTLMLIDRQSRTSIVKLR
ncbi:MAG TPA: hypothetical protein V6C86_11085 [Oculatellaceae cyanobacterium]